MKWEDRLIQLLGKVSINQKEYDEFISIGDQLKSEKDYDSSLGGGNDNNHILTYNLDGQLVDHREPRVGIWKDYYENGQLRYERKYDKGRRMSSNCWNEVGNKIDCQE